MKSEVADPIRSRYLTQLTSEVLCAEKRIRSRILETPLQLAGSLSEEYGCGVFLKLENEQVTGSFKARGALNRILSCTDKQRSRGVITASTGNHGLAVSWALSALGIEGSIYLPETTTDYKVDRLSEYDVELVFHGYDGVEAEREARRVAELDDRPYVSPYNDEAVVAGQGTAGVELLRQKESLDAVFASVGGGGLISGVAAYLKSQIPGVMVVGCSPEASPVMHRSVEAGRLMELPILPTLSDGTAGGIEAGAVTFALCCAHVDEWVLVGEDAIARSMRRIHDDEGIMIEGSAGVAVAALEAHMGRFIGKNVAVIICGGNVAPDHFRDATGL